MLTLVKRKNILYKDKFILVIDGVDFFIHGDTPITVKRYKSPSLSELDNLLPFSKLT